MILSPQSLNFYKQFNVVFMNLENKMNAKLLILSIKIKALKSALSEEQLKVYNKSIEEDTNALDERLKSSNHTEPLFDELMNFLYD